MLLTMAWRNIWRNRTRSLVIIASIALGLIAGLFVMGLYQGMLNDRLRIVIDREVSHLQIHHPRFQDDHEAGYTLSRADSLQHELMKYSKVEVVSARSIAPGMLATSAGSSGVQVIGVDAVSENAVTKLDSKVLQGSFGDALKRNQLLMGKKLADKMELKPGSKVVLTFTDKTNSIVSAAFRISGIYRSDNSALDEVNVYVLRKDLDRLLGLTDECHEMAVRLKRDDAMDSAKQFLTQALPSYKVETWKDISIETRLMIETTDQYSIIFIYIIMLALAFGIINTMLMAVLERTHEIGMLVALGMNKLKLFLLVLWETVLLTLAGVPAGFGLGWLLLKYLQRVGMDFSSAGDAMSGFGFSNVIYPIFPWSQLLNVSYIVVVTAVLASLLPSYKALKLRPVEAMRH